MSNIRNSTSSKPNHRLWAHIILVYYVVTVVIYWLNRFNKDVTKLRVKFLATQRRGGASLTALITDIPGVKAGTVIYTLNKAMNSSVLRVAPKSIKAKVNAMLEDTANIATKGVGGLVDKATAILDDDDDDVEDFSKLDPVRKALMEALADPWEQATQYLQQGGDFKGLVTSQMETVFGPSKVVAINPVYNEEELQPVYAKYDKTKNQLEDLIDDYLGKIKATRDPEKIKQKQTSVFGPLYGSWGIERYGTTKGVKVNSLDFLCEYLEECKRQVRELEPLALEDPSCSAFVTFSNRVTQAAASTSLICQYENVWRGQAAPGPEEVIWTNLSLRFWEKNLRNLVMWALFIVIVITFTAIATALQVLVVGPVAKKMSPVTNLPVIGSVIQGIVPTLALVILLILLPIVLARMQRFTGVASESEVDFGVVTKYFWFQFFSVFVGSVIGGALLSQATLILQHPKEASNQVTSIIQNLFTSIPTKASFFINFILLKGLAGPPIKVLRIVGLVIFWVRSKLAATDRARTRLWADQTTNMGTAVADHTIVMLLMITFSVASPIILVFGFVYFLITSITERYQMIYVLRLPYESGGTMWKSAFTQIMVGLYTFLITMSFLLGAKGFQFTPLIIPAYLLVLMFHSQTLKLFTRPWLFMSLRSAALLDNVEQQSGQTEVSPREQEEIRLTYLSPVFKVTDEEHQKVLDDAKRVKQFFDGERGYHDMKLDQDDVPESELP